jgi:hypothetical protein
MDQLQLRKQVNSLNAYIDLFETWMSQMKREISCLPEDFFVDRFISGLKDNIKHTFQCQKLDTLLSAYWYAHQYDKAYLSNIKKATQLYQLLELIINNNANFFICHRCQQIQRALNVIECKSMMKRMTYMILYRSNQHQSLLNQNQLHLKRHCSQPIDHKRSS